MPLTEADKVIVDRAWELIESVAETDMAKVQSVVDYLQGDTEQLGAKEASAAEQTMPPPAETINPGSEAPPVSAA